MTPEEAQMVCGFLGTSQGSPGYGASTVRGLEVAHAVLTLELVTRSDGLVVRLRIPFAEMVMMGDLTFRDDPMRFGSLLALYLDEEVDTGLLSRRGSTEELVVITLSPDD